MRNEASGSWGKITIVYLRLPLLNNSTTRRDPKFNTTETLLPLLWLVSLQVGPLLVTPIPMGIQDCGQGYAPSAEGKVCQRPGEGS